MLGGLEQQGTAFVEPSCGNDDAPVLGLDHNRGWRQLYDRAANVVKLDLLTHLTELRDVPSRHDVRHRGPRTQRFEETKDVVGGISYPASRYGKVVYDVTG